MTGTRLAARGPASGPLAFGLLRRRGFAAAAAASIVSASTTASMAAWVSAVASVSGLVRPFVWGMVGVLSRSSGERAGGVRVAADR